MLYELKQNDILELDYADIHCVAGNDCHQCWFSKSEVACSDIVCAAKDRQDNTNVIFIEK